MQGHLFPLQSPFQDKRVISLIDNELQGQPLPRDNPPTAALTATRAALDPGIPSSAPTR
jgi:hypothetical protein